VQRLTDILPPHRSFSLDTKRVGTLLDEAVLAGATRIDGISFVASDNAIACGNNKL